MQVQKKMLAAVSCVAIALGAHPALSHHSFAMFDNEKTVTLVGTVKQFQWTNPHSWVQLLVKDPMSGDYVEWSIEGGSPNGLVRAGWKRNSIKPGDKVVVVIHPLRDGTIGGSLVTIAVDGQQIGVAIP